MSFRRFAARRLVTLALTASLSPLTLLAAPDVRAAGLLTPTHPPQEHLAQTAQGDLARASALILDDQCAAALPWLRRVVDKEPDQMSSVYPLALCLFEEGMMSVEPTERRRLLALAEDGFLRAQSLNPKASLIYMKLGKIALLQGQSEQAARYYQMGLAHLPDNAVLTFNLASVYDDMGRRSKAIALYEKTLALDPNFIYAHNNLGLLYEAQGEKRKAEAAYRRAIRLNPSYNYARLNLGALLMRANALRAAQRELKRAAAQEPGNPWAHLYLGDAYLRHGNISRAAQSYETAIRLNPRYAPAYYLLALVYGKQRRYDESLQAALAYMRLEPGGRYAGEALSLMSALRQIQTETARAGASVSP